MELKRIKQIAGYTDHARFLAACETETASSERLKVLGYFALPNGLLKAVYVYRGKRAIVVDALGIRKTVLEVPEEAKLVPEQD